MVADFNSSESDPPAAESEQPSTKYEHKVRLDDPTQEDLLEALEAAFDYRGDITLWLLNDEEVSGYLFNRQLDDGEPFIEIYPRDAEDRRRIACQEIRAIEFSGKDTASGRSWETWVKHYKEKKAARERGENVGTIGLNPLPFD